jgi:hypothetical protein
LPHIEIKPVIDGEIFDWWLLDDVKSVSSRLVCELFQRNYFLLRRMLHKLPPNCSLQLIFLLFITIF